MNDEKPMTLAQAADYLQVSKSTVSKLIKKGELTGRRTSGNSGKYLVLKSACIEYVSNPSLNRNASASAGEQTEGKTLCRSLSEVEYSTVIFYTGRQKN